MRSGGCGAAAAAAPSGRSNRGRGCRAPRHSIWEAVAGVAGRRGARAAPRQTEGGGTRTLVPAPGRGVAPGAGGTAGAWPRCRAAAAASPGRQCHGMRGGAVALLGGAAVGRSPGFAGAGAGRSGSVARHFNGDGSVTAREMKRCGNLNKRHWPAAAEYLAPRRRGPRASAGGPARPESAA